MLIFLSSYSIVLTIIDKKKAVSTISEGLKCET